MKKPLSPIIVRLFALLIFLSISSAIYILIPEKTSNPPINTKKENTPPVTISLPSSTIENAKPNTKQNTTTLPERLTAVLKVADRTYTLSFRPTETLLQTMQQLTAQSAQPFMFYGKEYPSLGYFVDEINGTKNDPQNGKYWIYYIDGQAAQIGISNYELKQNDLIEWKYEKSKF